LAIIIIIFKSLIFKFKYFKHEESSLIKFAHLFGIKEYNLDDLKLNVAHKKNIKNYLYSIPGFILYIKYKKNIQEDQVSYLLNEN